MPLSLTDKNDIFLLCPKCAEEGGVSVRLYCLSDAATELFHCDGCDESFGVEDINGLIRSVRRWEAVVAWLDKVPVFTPEK